MGMTDQLLTRRRVLVYPKEEIQWSQSERVLQDGLEVLRNADA